MWEELPSWGFPGLLIAVQRAKLHSFSLVLWLKDLDCVLLSGCPQTWMVRFEYLHHCYLATAYLQSDFTSCCALMCNFYVTVLRMLISTVHHIYVYIQCVIYLCSIHMYIYNIFIYIMLVIDCIFWFVQLSLKCVFLMFFNSITIERTSSATSINIGSIDLMKMELNHRSKINHGQISNRKWKWGTVVNCFRQQLPMSECFTLVVFVVWFPDSCRLFLHSLFPNAEP